MQPSTIEIYLKRKLTLVVYNPRAIKRYKTPCRTPEQSGLKDCDIAVGSSVILYKSGIVTSLKTHSFMTSKPYDLYIHLLEPQPKVRLCYFLTKFFGFSRRALRGYVPNFRRIDFNILPSIKFLSVGSLESLLFQSFSSYRF